MPAIEGIIWFLFLVDCLIYQFLIYTPKRWHKRTSHWAHKYFPLNKGIGMLYLFLVLWLGFALYRMNLLGIVF